MLRSIRKSAGTWVVRIFLLMLAALFGVGIWSDPGSMLRGRSSNAIASVGGVDIDTPTFGREYQADATRVRAMLGASFDADPATKMMVALGTIERLATGTQIALQSERLGLAVGDDAIRRDVLGNSAFHDSAGAFSQDLFLGRLAQREMSEASYVALLRADLVGRQMVGSVTAVANVPATLAERIYAIRHEARVADYLVVTAASRPLPPDPDEATLQEFYGAHIDRYTAPEYRSITYLWLHPLDLVAEVGVGDDEVKALYDQRIDSFRRPERRTVEQILAPDKAAAEAIVARLAAGEDFAAVAASVGQSPDQTALGTLTAVELPLPTLAEAVFALPAASVSAPIATALGWHVLRVAAIEPESTMPFDEVKAGLIAELAADRATDLAFEVANEVEDALAGGAMLEDAARGANVATQTVAAVTAGGRDPEGGDVALPEPRDQVLERLFEAPEGSVAAMVETADGGFFLARVDGVTPSQPIALAEAHDRVIADWRDQARDADAASTVADAQARLAAGEAFEAVAAGLGATIARSAPLSRAAGAADAPFSPDLLERLFVAREGDILAAPSQAGDGHVLVRVGAVTAADSGADPEGLAAVRADLERSFAQEQMEQFRALLDRRYPVDVLSEALEALL